MYCVLRQSMCNHWWIHDFFDEGLTQRGDWAMFYCLAIFAEKKLIVEKGKLVEN